MIEIDPLVEEARKAGQAYIDRFKGDLRAVCADLRERARKEGRQVVSLPPKPPRKRSFAGTKDKTNEAK